MALNALECGYVIQYASPGDRNFNSSCASALWPCNLFYGHAIQHVLRLQSRVTRGLPSVLVVRSARAYAPHISVGCAGYERTRARMTQGLSR